MNRRLFVKGFTFGWMGRRGEYREPYAVDSLRKLKDTGCESIALAFDTPQDTALSTRVYFDYESSPTDKDICFIIDKAHEIGMEVCLKPVINPRDGLWRAYIDFPDGADHYWKSWFASYRAYMRHYAEIAEETGCEMYCIGCEMVGTQRKTAYWREVIDVVRGVYNGIVTYMRTTAMRTRNRLAGRSRSHRDQRLPGRQGDGRRRRGLDGDGEGEGEALWYARGSV